MSMLKDLATLSLELETITIFRNVMEGDVMKSFKCLLRSGTEADGYEGICVTLGYYRDFAAALYDRGYANFTNYIIDALSEDENEYARVLARGGEVPEILKRCVDGELAVFQKVSAINKSDLAYVTGSFDGYLPIYEVSDIDIAAEYKKRVARISSTGWGMYARHVMFRLLNGKIVPVRSPDKISVDDLTGYENEREALIENIRALTKGLPAANTLLYGDAGTGKSSSVKAAANMFAPLGVRLVEMKKEQLHDIPALMEELRENPLKFIIFIDDLSFNKNDDNFSALKAALEGSASVKADNVVICATSNRRHLVKETFSDRDGDDVHRNDTIQEQNSLAERFGLTILFTRPSKELYHRIVRRLCEQKGIEVADWDALKVKASAFALGKGGMSPRAAEQFTDSLLAAEKVKYE